jgi:hypothetical protein
MVFPKISLMPLILKSLYIKIYLNFMNRYHEKNWLVMLTRTKEILNFYHIYKNLDIFLVIKK